MLFQFKDFRVLFDNKEIVKGVNLIINPGEIHAIMGPNGSGKSTLAKGLAGHPDYETAGEASLQGINLLDLIPDERALHGFFLGFQYPVEIPGVTYRQMLLAALNRQKTMHKESLIDEQAFELSAKTVMDAMQIPHTFLDRHVNVGFSGGEKKKGEILQMLLMNPSVILLDETDSGLDIDAIRVVASGVNNFFGKDKGLILITHYQRLLDYIEPHYVHVMQGGKIVLSGGPELARRLEAQGYDWIAEETRHA